MDSLQERFAKEIVDRRKYKDMKYVAVDSDGRVYAYPTRPYMNENNDGWYQVGYEVIGKVSADFDHKWQDIERIVDNVITLVPGQQTTITYVRKSNGSDVSATIYHSEVPEWATYLVVDASGCIYAFNYLPPLGAAGTGSEDDTFFWVKTVIGDNKYVHLDHSCPMTRPLAMENLIWKLERPGDSFDPETHVYHSGVVNMARVVGRITGVRMGYARRAVKYMRKVVEFKEERANADFGTHNDALSVSQFVIGMVKNGILEPDAPMTDIDALFDELDRNIDNGGALTSVKWARRFFELDK